MDEQRRTEQESRDEIRAVKAAFRRNGPDVERAPNREEKREEPEPEESRGGKARQAHFAPHGFLSHRSLTNFMTASARLRGISRGFNIFNVRPVAR